MDLDPTMIKEFWQTGPIAKATMLAIGGLLASALTSVLFSRLFLALVSRTETDLDDQVVGHLSRPVAVSVFLGSLYEASQFLAIADSEQRIINGVLGTIAVGIWSVAASRICNSVLYWMDAQSTMVNPRTRPVLDIACKAVIYGAAIWAVFLSWRIDVTAWLASAGIVGVAVGFAAKDTLSNLIAGVFILADAPYRLGDYLILDSGDRGRVTEIGIRATRILTNDDVEIIVPNAIMANARIINESGGPYEKCRIQIQVGVAYGVDIDKVRATLLQAADGVAGVVDHPPPRVRFEAFDDSALDFRLYVYIEVPAMTGRVKDALNVAVYKAFAREEIPIPFPQQDVYLHKIESP
jgi:MscS family membrane protein